MENKQRIIKEAYGELWETLKDSINSDGVFVGDTDIINDKLFNQWSFIGATHSIDGGRIVSGSRPKALKGIESNNGWVKINDKNDLPKESGVFHIIDLEGRITYFMYTKGSNDSTMLKYFTHYQLIIKPEKPLY